MSWQRIRETRRRLKRLSCATKHKSVGAWYDPDKGRYIKTNVCEFRKGYLRMIANRKVRHSKNVGSGGMYKKVYDHWNELY